jgi:hypothetical protein
MKGKNRFTGEAPRLESNFAGKEYTAMVCVAMVFCCEEKEGFEPPDPTLMGSQVYPGMAVREFLCNRVVAKNCNHFVNDARSGKGFDDFCQ